jgi:hypothetical protein
MMHFLYLFTARLYRDFDSIHIAGLLAFPQENESHFYSSGFLDHLLNYCTLHEFGKSKDTLTILDQFATVSTVPHFFSLLSPFLSHY